MAGEFLQLAEIDDGSFDPQFLSTCFPDVVAKLGIPNNHGRKAGKVRVTVFEHTVEGFLGECGGVGLKTDDLKLTSIDLGVARKISQLALFFHDTGKSTELYQETKGMQSFETKLSGYFNDFLKNLESKQLIYHQERSAYIARRYLGMQKCLSPFDVDLITAIILHHDIFGKLIRQKISVDGFGSQVKDIVGKLREQYGEGVINLQDFTRLLYSVYLADASTLKVVQRHKRKHLDCYSSLQGGVGFDQMVDLLRQLIPGETIRAEDVVSTTHESAVLSKEEKVYAQCSEAVVQALKDGKYLVKSLRADEDSFFGTFIGGCIKLDLDAKNASLRSSCFDWYANGKGTHKYTLVRKDDGTYEHKVIAYRTPKEEEEYKKPQEKKEKSKPQSTTYLSKALKTPLFGHNRGRLDYIVGTLHLESDSIHSRIMLIDGGTVGRPWSGTEKCAEFFIERCFTSVQELDSSSGEINEVISRIRITRPDTQEELVTNPGSAVLIYSDNLASRLLAIRRTDIIRERLIEQYRKVGRDITAYAMCIPIIFYKPQADETHGVSVYTLDDQKEDLQILREMNGEDIADLINELCCCSQHEVVETLFYLLSNDGGDDEKLWALFKSQKNLLANVLRGTYTTPSLFFSLSNFFQRQIIDSADQFFLDLKGALSEKEYALVLVSFDMLDQVASETLSSKTANCILCFLLQNQMNLADWCSKFDELSLQLSGADLNKLYCGRHETLIQILSGYDLELGVLQRLFEIARKRSIVPLANFCIDRGYIPNEDKDVFFHQWKKTQFSFPMLRRLLSSLWRFDCLWAHNKINPPKFEKINFKIAFYFMVMLEFLLGLSVMMSASIIPAYIGVLLIIAGMSAFVNGMFDSLGALGEEFTFKKLTPLGKILAIIAAAVITIIETIVLSPFVGVADICRGIYKTYKLNKLLKEKEEEEDMDAAEERAPLLPSSLQPRGYSKKMATFGLFAKRFQTEMKEIYADKNRKQPRRPGILYR